ncbi:MAG TPA: HupE/UreJ family protein [Gemmatimonadaceae bacterium]|nr:HupE/UreJ family protein [Gemmatimonadaceae bacterium]
MPRLSTRLPFALVAAALLARPAALNAHDIPARVTVLAFVKPEGRRLRLVVRVPLEAMRDITWPVRGPGYLELARAGSLLSDAARLWIANYIQLYEGDARLVNERIVATRVSLPSDRSFERWESALVHVGGAPLAADTEIIWSQAMLDVLFEYPIASDRARFSIRPALAHLGIRTNTVLRFLPPDGAERAFQYVGDPGLVRLDPRWHQAALEFVERGFFHILDGFDHLLFVLALVIPFRRLRPLIVIVTAFTVAHSITLIAAVAGLAPGALWFPPLVETLIALSILYAAFENVVGAELRRRWLIAFGFGLVHGFGFSFALRESLQFAGAHLATSLLTFNLGVELGQVAVLLVAVPVLNALFTRVVRERIGTILLSALVAHTAWHWMIDRGSTLSQYKVRWPAFDLALAAGAMRAVMLLLIIVGAGWLMSGLYRRLVPGPRSPEPAAAAK